MTTTNLPALLAAAREAQAVAPGQWHVNGTHSKGSIFIGGKLAGGIIEVRGFVGPPRCGRQEIAAHVVAANPAAVIATVDLAVRAMRVAVDLREVLSLYRAGYGMRGYDALEKLVAAGLGVQLDQYRVVLAELAALDEGAKDG